MDKIINEDRKKSCGVITCCERHKNSRRVLLASYKPSKEMRHVLSLDRTGKYLELSDHRLYQLTRVLKYSIFHFIYPRDSKLFILVHR